MLGNRIFRWVGLAAILATFAPAPASAQLGRLLKNKLRQTIAQAVVENVAPADTSTDGPGGGQAVKGLKGALGGALRRAPVAPATGPVFDDAVIEMTAAVLENFEKAVMAEATERLQLSAPPPIQKASSAFSPRQYAILKERVVPFCTAGVSTAGGGAPHVAQGGVFLVYSMKELMALGPRCAKLLLALGAVS